MKYKIKQHIGFKFRYPVHLTEDDIGKNKANGRCNRTDKVSVNVLVMAKDKKKNKKVTAGDLFGKLGKRGRDKSESADELKDEISFIDEGADNSIDVSGAQNNSDSDLDINELLRKYMPDYDSDENSDTPAEEESLARQGGILSRLKNTAAEKPATDTADKPSEDEQLISSLDNAFGIPAKKTDKDSFIDEYELNDDEISDEPDLTVDIPEEEPVSEKTASEKAAFEEEASEKAAVEPVFDEEFLAEPEETEKDSSDSIGDNIGEETEEPVMEKKSVFSYFGRRKNKEKPAPEMTVTDDADLLADLDDDMVTDKADDTTAEITEENPAENAADTSAEAEPVTEVEKTAEEAEEPAKVEEPSENPDELNQEIEEVSSDAEKEDENDEFDPTDINLMVAFGLDNKDNKKAKEFGDRLEAKQHSRESHKVKLDHPEFVDKTQIPKIRKEFRDKKISLWVRFTVCTVLTVLLMIFENIPLITKLFTGTEQQFAGVFDPAVYPVVYIMVSLQLMLLACFCAVDEITAGVKNIFRGTPTPSSMTALLTLGGIVYSAVLAVTVVSPNEPVMFNFVTAVSAMLTLICAMYNNKRESMNFAVIANRKPKHIVRHLPDEESEGEARAFAESEDACDVMKIEKTDFIDGFFGRLSRPDPSTGVFMTFAMSASVAIAVLFGIFVNLRGGDNTSVCRVVYSAMLMLAPLSAYVTFSYPMYRANIAAKEYDSAIIGDASLEEYSNASIISFDDKNVFPSYSVKVQNMRIYNNARIDRVLYYAASVFAYAGGPLQDVFEVATKDMGVSQNVKIFDTEAGFLATQVDGVNIIFGSSRNLQSRGLEIPEGALRDDVDLSDELSIMYMFRENKLVAKMYIKYVMDSDIDLILKQFSGSGLYVCVRTFDPNIDEAMIAKKAGMKKMPLKIVRYSSADEVGRYEEKVDSGLVTCGSPKSLLQVITYCGKVLHTKKTDIALGVLSVMIGAAILVLLLLADSLSVLSSLLIVLYQLVWLIPITIASKVFIR